MKSWTTMSLYKGVELGDDKNVSSRNMIPEDQSVPFAPLYWVILSIKKVNYNVKSGFCKIDVNTAYDRL